MSTRCRWSCRGLTTTVTTPAIYALGTLTTVSSLLVMGLAVVAVRALKSRRGGGKSTTASRRLLLINPNTAWRDQRQPAAGGAALRAART